MVKKILALFLSVLCMALIACGAMAEAEDSEERVVDLCHLFSESEVAQMNAKIDAIRTKYKMDCAIVTSAEVPENLSYATEEATQKYADDYYEEHGYGEGVELDGFIYLIDMKNRLPYLGTAGVMIDYISDRRLTKLMDVVDVWLQKGQYGQSALALLDEMDKILAAGIEEGHFRYDSKTGVRITGLYNRLTAGETILAGAAGLAAMLILGFSVWARYNLKKSTYKFNRETQSSVHLNRDEKIFLRQHVTRTHLSSGGGGRGVGGGGSGSGVHISSGGMSHGGGGGHHF